MGKIVQFPNTNKLCTVCNKNTCENGYKICNDCLDILLDNISKNLDQTILAIVSLTSPDILQSVKQILISTLFDIQNNKYN